MWRADVDIATAYLGAKYEEFATDCASAFRQEEKQNRRSCSGGVVLLLYSIHTDSVCVWRCTSRPCHVRSCAISTIIILLLISSIGHTPCSFL